MSELNLNLSPQERQRLISIYISQYNQTNLHIDRLLNTLDDIRNNLNNLVGNANGNINVNTNANRTSRQNRTSNSNSNSNSNMNNSGFSTRHNATRNANTNTNTNTNRNNRQFLNNRGPFIRYDYSNPIDRSTYISDTTNNNQDITSFLTTFLNSTVPIRPTQQQINNASHIVRYSEIQNPNSTTCAISLEPFSNSDNVRQIHYCGHMFFPEQFNQWFRNNVRCPVCRYDIRNYVANTTNNEPSTSTSSTSTTPTTNISTSSSSSILDTEFSNFSTNTNTNITDLNDNLLTSITNNFLTSLLTSPSSSNDRFVYDPSNNILLFETILRSNNNDNNPDQI